MNSLLVGTWSLISSEVRVWVEREFLFGSCLAKQWRAWFVWFHLALSHGQLQLQSVAELRVRQICKYYIPSNWYGTWQRFPISLQQIWHASLALAHQEVLSRARRVSQRIQGFLEPLGEQKRTLLRNWEFRPLESGTYLCSVDAQLHHTYCISDSNQT